MKYSLQFEALLNHPKEPLGQLINFLNNKTDDTWIEASCAMINYDNVKESRLVEMLHYFNNIDLKIISTWVTSLTDGCSWKFLIPY